MIVCLERFLLEAEERGSTFFIGLLEKQHVRLKGLFERRVVSSIFPTHIFFVSPCLLGRAYQVGGGYKTHQQEA